MLIVLLTVAFGVMCAVIALLCEKGKIKSWLLEVGSEAFCFCSILAVIIMTVVCITTQATNQASLASANAKREALVYQYEHGVYLGDAVGEFNAEIASGRHYRQSPWTSWFIGDYVMDVEPIDLSALEVSE